MRVVDDIEYAKRVYHTKERRSLLFCVCVDSCVWIVCTRVDYCRRGAKGQRNSLFGEEDRSPDAAELRANDMPPTTPTTPVVTTPVTVVDTPNLQIKEYFGHVASKDGTASFALVDVLAADSAAFQTPFCRVHHMQLGVHRLRALRW